MRIFLKMHEVKRISFAFMEIASNAGCWAYPVNTYEEARRQRAQSVVGFPVLTIFSNDVLMVLKKCWRLINQY